MGTEEVKNRGGWLWVLVVGVVAGGGYFLLPEPGRYGSFAAPANIHAILNAQVLYHEDSGSYSHDLASLYAFTEPQRGNAVPFLQEDISRASKTHAVSGYYIEPYLKNDKGLAYVDLPQEFAFISWAGYLWCYRQVHLHNESR